MFKKNTKRVARRIGRTDDDDDDDAHRADGHAQSTPAVVKPRPKTRPSAAARSSFAAVDDGDRTPDGGDIAATRKVGLSRVALERAAAERLPIRESSHDDDIYSADQLQALRTATPTRPAAAANQRWEAGFEQAATDGTETNGRDLDLTSKFGVKAVSFDLTRQQESVIPSAAEIKEKKERRRRLALEEQAEDDDHEQDFISLNDTSGTARRISRATPDSEDETPRSRSLIIPAEEYEHTSKWAESRLVRDDEDIAEGFDDFVDDPGKVVMGLAGQREQQRARRAEMEKQIRSAQRTGRADGPQQQQRLHQTNNDNDDSDDGSVSDDDLARIRAYEASQTRHGRVSGGAHLSSREKEKQREESLRKRLHHMPKPGPIPDISEVVERFRQSVVESQQSLQQAQAHEVQLAREAEEIAAEEVRIKQLLQEAGDKFERLKGESFVAVDSPSRGGMAAGEQQALPPQPRGLESFGGMSGMPRDEYDE